MKRASKVRILIILSYPSRAQPIILGNADGGGGHERGLLLLLSYPAPGYLVPGTIPGTLLCLVPGTTGGTGTTARLVMHCTWYLISHLMAPASKIRLLLVWNLPSPNLNYISNSSHLLLQKHFMSSVQHLQSFL